MLWTYEKIETWWSHCWLCSVRGMNFGRWLDLTLSDPITLWLCACACKNGGKQGLWSTLPVIPTYSTVMPPIRRLLQSMIWFSASCFSTTCIWFFTHCFGTCMICALPMALPYGWFVSPLTGHRAWFYYVKGGPLKDCDLICVWYDIASDRLKRKWFEIVMIPWQLVCAFGCLIWCDFEDKPNTVYTNVNTP